MNRTLTLAMALAAGLLGGLLSRYLAPVPVHAQAQAPAPKEIRAQNFVLVNSQGVEVGLMGFDPQGRPVIKLVDEGGRTLWSAGQALLLPQPPGR
jgi:hypothetical protein